MTPSTQTCLVTITQTEEISCYIQLPADIDVDTVEFTESIEERWCEGDLPGMSCIRERNISATPATVARDVDLTLSEDELADVPALDGDTDD